jgi:hypothetical protein
MRDRWLLLVLFGFFCLIPTITIGQSQLINGDRVLVGTLNYGDATGSTGDTYVAALNPAITTYITGARYLFKAPNANVGAATLNLNGVGAKTIVKVVGGVPTTLADNDIRAGQYVEVVYDSAGDNFQILSTLGAVPPLGTSFRIKTCLVTIGDPGATSPVLAVDNDTPAACPNDFGVAWTITTVACYANINTGAPSIDVVFTGGASILTGPVACGNAVFAPGALSGTPVVNSFSGAGATCSSPPCSLDVNVNVAGGTAKYLQVKITGMIPAS